MQWNNTNVNNYATSTIHNYLNNTYCNTLPTQDREKLGAKAVQEEFHGNGLSGTDFKGKQLYGWNTVTASVWLPSLCELVGYDPNKYYEPSGVYFSAMQGVGLSSDYYVDAQGGSQFAYFAALNQAGGGTAVWNTCNRQQSWLRSSYALTATYAWIISGLNRFNAYEAYPLTDSHTVHPAVE